MRPRERSRQAGDRSRRRPGRGRVPGRSRPDTLVGLPRQDVRLVGPPTRRPCSSSTARASARSRSSSGRPIPRRRRAGRSPACRPSRSTASPAHELATQLGTVLEWQRNGVAYVLAGSLPPAAAETAARDAEVSEAPPVDARGLVKRYGEIVAVDHVDLTVERGDVFGYLGPNGAGKTTSLRMMLGLIRPTEGSARLFGRDPLVDGAKALDGVAGLRRGAALLPVPVGRARTCGCSPTTTSRLSLADRGGARARRAARPGQGPRRRLLARDAPAARDRRLAAARAEAAAARRADDRARPGRDARHARARAQARGRRAHVLLSSHLLCEVEELCNRVAIIRKGRIVYEGSLSELLATAASGYRLRTTEPERARACSARAAGHRRRRARRTASSRSRPTRMPSRPHRSRSARRASRSPQLVPADREPRGAVPRHDRRRVERPRPRAAVVV